MTIKDHNTRDEVQVVAPLDAPQFRPFTTNVVAQRPAPLSARRLRLGIALETRNLSRAVAGKVLVNDFNVLLIPGEVLAVVGPSGAGKSSFLRLLNRLDEPTGGTSYVDGLDYREIPPRVLRRRLGMVMQTPFLFPGTVAENIRFGPRQHGETLD